MSLSPDILDSSTAFKNENVVILDALPITPPHVVARLYEQVALIHKTCLENKIPYWLIGGSLLGQVRHGGQIPWDDDCDVGIHLQDMERLKAALAPIVAEHEMTIWNGEHGLKLKCKGRGSLRTAPSCLSTHAVGARLVFTISQVLGSEELEQTFLSMNKTRQDWKRKPCIKRKSLDWPQKLQRNVGLETTFLKRS